MKIVRVTDEERPYVTYDDVEFQIKYVPDQLLDDVRERCKEKKYVGGQKKEFVSDPKVMKEIFKEAVINWRNFPVSKLNALLDPDFKVQTEAEKPDDEFAFSADNKRLLAENMHAHFASFIFISVRSVNVFNSAKQAKEIENLECGSGGRDRPTMSAKKD